MEAKRKNKLTKEEMTGRIEALAQKRRTKESIQLPICFDDKRATPNSFIRSALFSAVLSKDRVFLNNVDLASQDGITVNYKGEQLNQDDLTLLLALIHLTKEQPLGSVVTLPAHSILKAMGLNTGGDEHKRLHEGIRRLNGCSVQISHVGKKYGGPVWMQTNYLLIQTIEKMHRYLGDAFTFPAPCLNHYEIDLKYAANTLTERLVDIFRRDESGLIPAFPEKSPHQTSPHWRDLLLFHEYFHGETGRGLGAAHQTGWSGLLANLVMRRYRKGIPEFWKQQGSAKT